MDFWAYFFFRIILNTYICDGLIISLTVWCVLNSSSLYIFIYTHFIGASFFYLVYILTIICTRIGTNSYYELVNY